MKTVKVLFSILVLAISVHSAKAQFINLQIHKEFGSINVNETTKVKRDAFRAKFEMLGFDSLGTFYIASVARVSMEDQTTDANLQVLRGFKIFKKTDLQPIVGFSGVTGTTNQYYVGLHYPLLRGRVKFLPYVAYVYNKDQKSADFRITSGVSTLLAKNKILIFGFVNAYTKDKLKSVSDSGEENYGKEVGFQANPQVWYRFNKKLALGSEIGLDYVASRYQEFIVIPTAAFRWVL